VENDLQLRGSYESSPPCTSSIISESLPLCVCVCVCVCGTEREHVCEREREGEREAEWMWVFIHLCVFRCVRSFVQQYMQHCQRVFAFMCAYVCVWERERAHVCEWEREIDRKRETESVCVYTFVCVHREERVGDKKKQTVHKSIWIKKTPTSNQSSKPCTVLQYL